MAQAGGRGECGHACPGGPSSIHRESTDRSREWVSMPISAGFEACVVALPLQEAAHLHPIPAIVVLELRPGRIGVITMMEDDRLRVESKGKTELLKSVSQFVVFLAAESLIEATDLFEVRLAKGHVCGVKEPPGLLHLAQAATTMRLLEYGLAVALPRWSIAMRVAECAPDHDRTGRLHLNMEVPRKTVIPRNDVIIEEHEDIAACDGRPEITSCARPSILLP
jgi:hypothetical protein